MTGSDNRKYILLSTGKTRITNLMIFQTNLTHFQTRRRTPELRNYLPLAPPAEKKDYMKFESSLQGKTYHYHLKRVVQGHSD